MKFKQRSSAKRPRAVTTTVVTFAIGMLGLAFYAAVCGDGGTAVAAIGAGGAAIALLASRERRP